MSDCIITIQIGDRTITLDPNSNIGPDSKDYLVNTLDISKIRALYSNLRSQKDIDFSGIVPNANPTMAAMGKAIYDDIVEKVKTSKGGSDRDKFISPVGALRQVTDPAQREALANYIATLDPSQTVKDGNFLNNMGDAYMASPYTKEDIRNLAFSSSSRAQAIYDSFTNVPGMEALKISIAYADDINGTPISKPTGAYLRPDNIVQVLVPTEYYKIGNDDRGIQKTNLTPEGLKLVSNTIIHELAHAIYSETYISNPTFRKSFNELYTRFNNYIFESPDRASLQEAYGSRPDKNGVVKINSDKVHEFLSDIFDSNPQAPLIKTLHNMSSEKSDYSSASSSFYRELMEKMSPIMQNADSVLKDALAITADSLPTSEIADTFEKQLSDYIDPSDKRNLFYGTDGMVTPEETEKHMAPPDQTASYWSINSQAYRMQLEYLNRTQYDPELKMQTLKDAFYEENIDKPTKEQIDRLYGRDLVLIPFFRYSPVENQADGSKLGGNLIEQGIVMKSAKVPALNEKGKPLIVDITRDTNGKIIQNSEKGTIEERLKHVPVMYSNIKAGKVVIAKVGLGPEANAAGYSGYNTMSIPYSFIRGIRRYNRNYFDHNLDYKADLVSAEEKLKSSQTDQDGVEARFDRTGYYAKQVELAKANILKAEKQRNDLEELHNKYAFNRIEEDKEGVKTYYKNVPREQYIAAGWETKNLANSVFPDAEDAVFNIAKRGSKNVFIPNPKKFISLWEDNSGSAFAKTSKQMSDIVSTGDLIRIHSTRTVVGDDGEKTTVEAMDWMPVYQKVANGVQVGTRNGKGLIVNFNNIDAYAKNVGTESWKNLLLNFNQAHSSFQEAAYPDAVTKAARKSENLKLVNWKSLTYDPKFEYRDTNEQSEDSISRFGRYRDKTIADIKPGETFVQVKRKFKSNDPSDKQNGGVKEYNASELVLAKDDTGLTTLRRNSSGALTVDRVKFDDKISDHQHYAQELMWTMENLGSLHDMWKQYTDELALFDENKQTDAWTNIGTEESPKYQKNFDFQENPRNFRDWYDMYEDIDGVKLNRLAPGDIVGIKTKEGTDIPRYFRKVLRVMDDGRVSVAEYRSEDFHFPDGGVGKKGLYSRFVKPENIDRVGYKIGKVGGDKDTGFTSEFHQDIIDRRVKLMEYANRDKDYDDFNYAYTTSQAENFNKGREGKSGKQRLYVPLTNKVLDPKAEGKEIFLNRKHEPVDKIEDAAQVMAWTKNGVVLNAERGIRANTRYWKADRFVIKDGEGKLSLHQAMENNLKPGDWVITPYKEKGTNKVMQRASAIDRIEGGNIYTINHDYSTHKVSLDKIVGIRTSARNDTYSEYGYYKRSQGLHDALPNGGKKADASLDLQYKSPRDSRRALLEIGNRMQALNPDIQIEFKNTNEIALMGKPLNFDYTQARAFVLDGAVYVNTDKASVSDVVHEYAHLFLHSLKYDAPDLYDAVTTSAVNHPIYADVAQQYQHLTNSSDLNEEVFVTLLGEYMGGRLRGDYQQEADNQRDVMNQYAEYSKDKLITLLNGDKTALANTDAGTIQNMRLYDVIGLVGDHIMTNRIGDDIFTLDTGRDVESIKRALKERGVLIEECYG